jgi:hypothetical protein
MSLDGMKHEDCQMWIASSGNHCLVGLLLGLGFTGQCHGQEANLTLSGVQNEPVKQAGQSPSGDSKKNHSRTVDLSEGDSAPDMSLVGLDATRFRLSELTGRGKNVVLLFSRAHW